jgi:hypothetical protein
MIALSWLFLLGAIATLLIGVFTEPIAWIWASIGSSALAMILLVVGIVRGKPVQPATAGAPYGPAVGTADARGRPAATAAKAATATSASAKTKAPAGTSTQRRPATPAAPTAPARKPAARKPAAKKTTAKKTSAKKPAAKKTSAAARSTRGTVVAIPERGTYHKSECRYVQGRTDTEKLSASTAKSRGFKACGVCKP